MHTKGGQAQASLHKSRLGTENLFLTLPRQGIQHRVLGFELPSWIVMTLTLGGGSGRNGAGTFEVHNLWYPNSWPKQPAKRHQKQYTRNL